MLPGKSKLIRRLKHAFLGAVIILVMVSGAARAGEWPLVLPDHIFGTIPDAQGMDYFIGMWWATSAFAVGSRDMTVTHDSMEFREMQPISGFRYRVIHETPNYILLVTQRLKINPTARTPYPTRFMILTLQSYGIPVTRRTDMRRHSCGSGMWGTPEAFHWSLEKLMRTFKTSLCLKQVEIGETIAIGWGHGRFQRDESSR
jgi:hypothetical protein